MRAPRPVVTASAPNRLRAMSAARSAFARLSAPGSARSSMSCPAGDRSERPTPTRRYLGPCGSRASNSDAVSKSVRASCVGLLSESRRVMVLNCEVFSFNVTTRP